MTHRFEAATNSHTLPDTDNAQNVSSDYFVEQRGPSEKSLSNTDNSYYNLFIFQAAQDQEM